MSVSSGEFPNLTMTQRRALGDARVILSVERHRNFAIMWTVVAAAAGFTIVMNLLFPTGVSWLVVPTYIALLAVEVWQIYENVTRRRIAKIRRDTPVPRIVDDWLLLRRVEIWEAKRRRRLAAWRQLKGALRIGR